MVTFNLLREKMNGIKNTLDFVTLFVAFVGTYKIWLLICIGCVGYSGYKFFTDNYTMHRSMWLKLFLISLAVAVSSNLYFWFDTKAELQQRNGQGGLELPR